MCQQIGAILLIDDSVHYALEVAAVLPQVLPTSFIPLSFIVAVADSYQLNAY
jgi:hypothetical protein